MVSAFIAAQGMIRYSDETASFVFLFSGIILSIFGIRGDRILLIWTVVSFVAWVALIVMTITL